MVFVDESASAVKKETFLPPRNAAQRGAVLVYVLWVLAVLSFLAAQVAGRTRERAGEAYGLWQDLQREEALRSVVRLFALAPAVSGLKSVGVWRKFEFGNRVVWVKWDNEAGRVNLSASEELNIRQMVNQIVPDEERAEALVDALLDWQDADDLVRLNGAEKEYYVEHNLPVPRNSPFTSICELRSVRGVRPELFWGDPLVEAVRQWNGDLEMGDQADLQAGSLSDAFSIIGRGAKRLTVLLPRSEETYDVEIVVLKSAGAGWAVVDRCRGFVDKIRD